MIRMTNGLALLATLLLAACSQQDNADSQGAAEPVLETSEQRLSYGIAYGLGERLDADGVPIDVDAFNAGIRDAFEGNERRLTQEEIAAEMQAYQAARVEEQEAAAEQAAEAAEQAAIENAAAGDAFRDEYAQAEGVSETESGLLYKAIEAGEGPKPTAEDAVEVHYRGTLVDGTEFDSSYARGESVTFGLSQVIPGWTEGLQLMSVGSKYQLVIPPELAYGPAGAGQSIGPNSTLVFEVELLDIVSPGDEAAEDEAAEEGES